MLPTWLLFKIFRYQLHSIVGGNDYLLKPKKKKTERKRITGINS